MEKKLNRLKKGKITSIIGIGFNLVLFVVKLAIGILTNALSVTADAVNNLSDASSSIITLIGFKLSEKPADEDHPYGHGRFEYISGMIVAATIIFIGFEVGESAIKKILHPEKVQISLVAFLVLACTMMIKLLLALYYFRVGRQISSHTLRASAVDCRNDVITTGAIILALVIEENTEWYVDGYISLLVATFIFYSGIRLIKEIVNPLVGMSGSQEMKVEIAKIVESKEKVIGHHDLLVHDYGPNHCFASIHVEVDHRENAIACHDMIDEIERECEEQLGVHLVVHYDPIITDDKELTEMKAKVSAILKQFDARLSMHDFRMARENQMAKLIFDVSLPDDLQKKKAKIRDFIEEELKEEKNEYFLVIVFDPRTDIVYNE